MKDSKQVVLMLSQPDTEGTIGEKNTSLVVYYFNLLTFFSVNNNFKSSAGFEPGMKDSKPGVLMLSQADTEGTIGEKNTSYLLCII